MNTVITVQRDGQREKEQYKNAYEFALRIEELCKDGTILYYGENDIGGVSAIIEVGQ